MTGRFIAMVTTAAAGMALLPAAASAEPCAPAIVIEGSDLVGDELLARGVLGSSDCGELHIEILKAPDGTLLVRSEIDGVLEERSAVDATAAATIVESWARADLAAPLLAVREIEKAPSIEPRLQSTVEPSPQRRVQIGVASELGLGLDGSTWTGLALAACFNLHVVCVGAAVRAAIDNRTSGDSKDRGASRYGIDTVFTVDVPIQRGRITLLPGIGIGQGAQRMKRDNSDNDDEQIGVRIRGRVGVGYHLAGNISLYLNPEIGWSPGNPRLVVDADEPEPFTYPGDPGLHFRLGIGVLLEAL